MILHLADEGIAWTAACVEETVRPGSKLCIISDEQVALLYVDPLRVELAKRGHETVVVTFPPGEKAKTLRQAEKLLDQFTDHRLARDDFVIGLGGGVTTDLAGFAASIYLRGMPWIAVPTSLLGMVDAAIGGKTGVNHPLAKNLIGTFHQPQAMIAPLQVLSTLSPREMRSGSAEVVKSALISGGRLWSLVKANGPDLGTWPREALHEAIALSVQTKTGIVEPDERESGLRRVLNLGHTFGHALEAVTRFRVFSHGEAVFHGLRAAVHLSRSHAGLSEDEAQMIERVLLQAVYPSATVSADALIDALQHDKKIASRKLHWILLAAIGHPVITSEVPDASIKDTAAWLAETVAQGQANEPPKAQLNIVVINGPNLNLLGEREPEIYGPAGCAELEQLLERAATERGVNLVIRQSNVEGELVSLVQQARHWADGIILNPGGYTHTSVALRDAIAAVAVPTIEVHLSDLLNREDFRRRSLTASVCAGQIMGKGQRGYLEALEILISMVNNATVSFGRKLS